MMRTALAWVSTVLVVVSAGCGVNIQTGPEDQQRQSEVADYKAKEIRAQYAEQLRAADPVRKAELMKSLIDSVSAGYIRYGQSIVREWRNAIDGRGADVPDTDMRALVGRSNQSQQAIFGAYEDVVDLAMDEIKLAGQLEAGSLNLLDRYRNQFYKVRSTAFYPSGTPDRYEQELADIQAETERLSRELERDLRRY